MKIKTLFITNDEVQATVADGCGVDFVSVDLEIIGKIERQGHLNTRISHHQIEDVRKLRPNIKSAQLMVRINPIHPGTELEVDTVIKYGANVIMLPYFKTVHEVRLFLDFVRGRAKTCLLLETKEAEEVIDEILKLPGIDMIHIGINDLSISKGQCFLFEPLLDDSFDCLCQKIIACGIPFGFGGIAQLDQGLIPAQLILAEHYRLGSSMVILARSFINLDSTLPFVELMKQFSQALEQIRSYVSFLERQDTAFFIENQRLLRARIREIVHERQS